MFSKGVTSIIMRLHAGAGWTNVSAVKVGEIGDLLFGGSFVFVSDAQMGKML